MSGVKDALRGLTDSVTSLSESRASVEAQVPSAIPAHVQVSPGDVVSGEELMIVLDGQFLFASILSLRHPGPKTLNTLEIHNVRTLISEQIRLGMDSIRDQALQIVARPVDAAAPQEVSPSPHEARHAYPVCHPQPRSPTPSPNTNSRKRSRACSECDDDSDAAGPRPKRMRSAAGVGSIVAGAMSVGAIAAWAALAFC